jgi:hypothetical protein
MMARTLIAALGVAALAQDMEKGAIMFRKCVLVTTLARRKERGRARTQRP